MTGQHRCRSRPRPGHRAQAGPRARPPHRAPPDWRPCGPAGEGPAASRAGCHRCAAWLRQGRRSRWPSRPGLSPSPPRARERAGNCSRWWRRSPRPLGRPLRRRRRPPRWHPQACGHGRHATRAGGDGPCWQKRYLGRQHLRRHRRPQLYQGAPCGARRPGATAGRPHRLPRRAVVRASKSSLRSGRAPQRARRTSRQGHTAVPPAGPVRSPPRAVARHSHGNLWVCTLVGRPWLRRAAPMRRARLGAARLSAGRLHHLTSPGDAAAQAGPDVQHHDCAPAEAGVPCRSALVGEVISIDECSHLKW